MSSDWVETSEAVVEEEEEEEGYAMGEAWGGGGLKEREASRSLGGCLGRREATDMSGTEEGGRDGSDADTYIDRRLVVVFQLLDCLGLCPRPNDETKTAAGIAPSRSAAFPRALRPPEQACRKFKSFHIIAARGVHSNQIQ